MDHEEAIPAATLIVMRDVTIGPPELLMVERGATEWTVRQIIEDPEGHRDWSIVAVVDLPASDAAGEPVIRTRSFGRAQPG